VEEVLMQFFALVVVGLLAGLLASRFFGGVGYGLRSDILIGIAGALLGGWLFGALDVGVPFSLGGSILVAFSGAVAVLLLLRVVNDARRTRDRWTRSPPSSSPWRP
jgi:uncharacterized membrane protein YeaQ/YmgE (transglycosylase-associated protein family)